MIYDVIVVRPRRAATEKALSDIKPENEQAPAAAPRVFYCNHLSDGVSWNTQQCSNHCHAAYGFGAWGMCDGRGALTEIKAESEQASASAPRTFYCNHLSDGFSWNTSQCSTHCREAYGFGAWGMCDGRGAFSEINPVDEQESAQRCMLNFYCNTLSDGVSWNTAQCNTHCRERYGFGAFGQCDGVAAFSEINPVDEQAPAPRSCILDFISKRRRKNKLGFFRPGVKVTTYDDDGRKRSYWVQMTPGGTSTAIPTSTTSTATDHPGGTSTAIPTSTTSTETDHPGGTSTAIPTSTTSTSTATDHPGGTSTAIPTSTTSTATDHPGGTSTAIPTSTTSTATDHHLAQSSEASEIPVEPAPKTRKQ
uniref:Uncharacterized protein n=1 Tax=Branchiostoma floridae TaxID=7739 RepID=C3Y3H6_BRAFL|eukprot:XP_002609233.1 hypothetical protein BRAFLDRAFT_125977 [Branchiostoma floridae]